MTSSWGDEGWRRIDAALDFLKDGVPDGDHHKAWVIDQIVRILTGGIVEETSPLAGGQKITYLSMTDQYFDFVQEYEAGKDGPKTYEWDTGIAP